MLDGLTLDQIGLFLRVVEAGSFSGAARAENRATSAVTYAVGKMEEQLGLALFDRDQYRPVLTEAGRALLPRAERVVREVRDLRVQARSISGGLEAQIAIAVDTIFPMDLLSAPLREFQSRFPAVQIRISVESLGNSSRLVSENHCAIGLLTEYGTSGLDLRNISILDLSLVMVAAPNHELSRIGKAISPSLLNDHVQLVLTDRYSPPGSRDVGIYSTLTWRLSDIGAKQEMLRAGLGFGSLPLHLAKTDLDGGRLVRLELANEFGGGMTVPMVLSRRKDLPMGPATHWLVERLTRRDLSSQREQLSLPQARVADNDRTSSQGRVKASARRKRSRG